MTNGMDTAEAPYNAEPAVLPKLREWKGGIGTVKITASSRIALSHAEFMPQAKIVSEYVSDILGSAIEIVTAESSEGDIVIGYTDEVELGKEGYTVELSDRVIILAHSDVGALYGGSTVSQMLTLYDGFELPRGYIKDYPAYEVRASMLDVSGHYIPIGYLTDMSKYLAYFKVNQIHIHVNENAGQNAKGFRIESKRYPKINTNVGDNVYTQEEYRAYQTELLKYGVKVITELDSPAHAGFAGLHDPSLVMENATGNLDLTNNYDGCVAFIKGLVDEFINGYDGDPPVIINEIDTIHLGMDEYYHNHDQYKRYMKEICDYVRSQGKKVQVWSALKTADFAEELPISAENVIVNYWGDADMKAYAEAGFPAISNYPRMLYVLPGETNYFGDWSDVPNLYDNYEANMISPSMILDESSPLLLGVEGSIWHHWNCGASKEGIFARVRDQMLLVSEKAWYGKTEGVTGKEFEKRLRALQNLVPVLDPQSFVPSDEHGVIADYDFESAENGTVKDNAQGLDATLEGLSVNGSELILDGKGYLSLPVKQIGFPYTVSFGLTYSSTTSGVLFAGGDTTFLLDKDGDGKLMFTRELHSYTFDFVFAKNVHYDITLLCDREKLSLYVDGVYVRDARVTSMKTFNQKFENVYFSESVLSCARIGEGIVGRMDNLRILGTADKDALSGLADIGYRNLALGKKATASGTEVKDKWLPENATDGISEISQLKVSLNRADDAWLTIDLGKTYSVGKIKMRFFKAPAAYKLLVSKDGADFTEIYDQPSANAGKKSKEVIKLFEAVEARYVKYQQVKMFSVISKGTTESYSAAIGEIEVMGTETEAYLLNKADNYLKTITGDERTHLYNRIALVKRIISHRNTDVSALALKLLDEEYERMLSSSHNPVTSEDSIYNALLDIKPRNKAGSDAAYIEYETAYKLLLSAYINSGSTEAVKTNRLSLLEKVT